MSKFKRALSAFLVFAMVVGMLSCLSAVVAPKASAAEGTSKIDSYAALDAAYDDFIYIGTEVYEIETEDGTLSTDVTSSELTDYYVDPGQLLMVYLYVKSDMYCGNGTFVSVNDNAFFDVTQMTAAAPNSTAGYTQGLVGMKNSAHPAVSKGGAKNASTSANAYTIGWIKGSSGLSQEVLEAWDITQQVLTYDSAVNTTGEAYDFTSDLWFFSWYAKVRNDVTEGKTGEMKTVPELWKSGDKFGDEEVTVAKSNQKQANLAFKTKAQVEADGSTIVRVTDTTSMYANYANLGYFIYDDMCHTFTCGKNPAAGGTTQKKYTVTFLDSDDSEISAAQYVKGASVEVPTDAENQIGWANVSNGKVVDLSTYTVVGDVTFKRLLSTDEIAVTINLNGGAIADESSLPANASIDENGNLVVKATYGDEVDLTALPTPEKVGYTASWNPETVTVNNTKGVSASVTWTAKTYTATFYNNKGDETPVVTKEIAYDATLSCNNAVGADGYKFAGWADAETDEVVSTNASIGKYTYTENKSYYAVWTPYNSSITFMIRDFVNGGWKIGAVKYADEGTKLTSTQLTNIINEIAKADNATALGAVYNSEDIKFDNKIDNASVVYEGQVLYVTTEIDFNITWKVPVYDNEAGEFTGEYTETPATAELSYNMDSVYLTTTADTTVPFGYTFNGWIDEATGETVNYHSTLGIKLTGTSERNIVLVADIQEAEYTIVFNMNNNQNTKFVMDDTVKMGESIVTEGATFTNNGNAVNLPVVGIEGGSQATPVYNRYGYMLMGWKIGTGANAVDITFPVDELTAEMIESYASNGNITIYAQWEAIEYELKFYYANAETDMTKSVTERNYAEPFVVKYKTGESISRTLSEAEQAIVNANIPEGYTFLNFAAAEGVLNNMPAYGASLYARYSVTSIKVYIDYNNGKTDEEGNVLPLSETMVLAPQLNRVPLKYGEDPEVQADIETGTESAIGFVIKAEGVTTANKPGEDYEVVAWNAYHVNAGDDIYDKENWKSGINDEGTNVAKTTLIYQAEWKQHSEFFFRVYDTNSKLCMALGKDFKMYYWAGGTRPCTRSETQVNRDPDGIIVLLYSLELEYWSWDNFFSFDMWNSLTFKVDPIFVPKSMFTWESFVALMGALGNLIKSLF